MDKRTLLPAPTNGTRRTSRLVNEDQTRQMSGAQLFVNNEEELSQVKLWNEAFGYVHAVFDLRGNLVALGGPNYVEKLAWQDAETQLIAKDYLD